MKINSKLIYYFLLGSIVIILSISNKTKAQTYSVSAGTTDANGIYLQTGTNDGVPLYSKSLGSGSNNNPCYVYRVSGWYLVNTSLTTSDANTYLYYCVTSGLTTMPIGSGGIWSNSFGGTGVGTCTTTSNATTNMTFVDGSGYSVSAPIVPSTNSSVGRFQLSASASGAVLNSVTVALSGTRSGISNVKLWYGSIGGTQLGTSQTDGPTVTFSGINCYISTSGTTFYISVDLTSSTGGVTATIPSQASFTFAGANAPSSFTNAPLSSSAVPLPIELSSFSAKPVDGTVFLKWSTATEINNYGFNIERSVANINKDWETIGFVSGNGSSNSPKEYSFVDKSPLSGVLLYRLKQIDTDGTFKYYTPIQITIKIAQFTLDQNYPNPFNPVTLIKYSLPEKSNVKLAVYNLLGQEIVVLVDKEEEGGVYNVEFNASKLASGVYFYKLNAGNYSSVKKLLVTK